MCIFIINIFLFFVTYGQKSPKKINQLLKPHFAYRATFRPPLATFQCPFATFDTTGREGRGEGRSMRTLHDAPADDGEVPGPHEGLDGLRVHPDVGALRQVVGADAVAVALRGDVPVDEVRRNGDGGVPHRPEDDVPRQAGAEARNFFWGGEEETMEN